MSPSEPNTQPAADRRAAEAELSELVAKIAPVHEALVGAMCRSLRKRLPTAHEVVYEYADCVVISYSPSGRGHEGVLSIRASAKSVELYFNNGKQLTDPDKLLKGSAKLVRFIQIESAATLRRAAVVDLIDEALVRNSVPFAATGRGTVVVRPTTARKRRG